jgi:hypothetical protein
LKIPNKKKRVLSGRPIVDEDNMVIAAAKIKDILLQKQRRGLEE